MDSKVPLQGQSQSGNLIKKTLDANINASTLLSLVARVQPTTNTVVYSSRIQQGKQSKRTQRPPLVLQVTGTARSANMILKPFYDDFTPINHPVSAPSLLFVWTEMSRKEKDPFHYTSPSRWALIIHQVRMDYYIKLHVPYSFHERPVINLSGIFI